MTEENSHNERKHLVFKLDGKYFSLGLKSIREVLPKYDLAPIPNPPPFLLGTINLRGNIISTYDLGLAFTTKQTEIKKLKSCLLVLNIKDNDIGILVEEAVNVKDFFFEDMQELDESIKKNYQNLVTSVFKKESHLIFKINEENLLQYLGYKVAA